MGNQIIIDSVRYQLLSVCNSREFTNTIKWTMAAMITWIRGKYAAEIFVFPLIFSQVLLVFFSNLS